MQGLTISEMAKKLGLSYTTTKQRLFQVGIKPITKEAIYPKSALEKIRNVTMGRPKTKKKPK